MAIATHESAVSDSNANDENAVGRFIRRTRELFAREADLDARWAALPPILQDLLADPSVQDASHRWPNPASVPPEPGSDGRRSGNLLFYEDPDFGFVINGQIHEGGGRPVEPTHAHDHGNIYTAYGLLDGHERIVMYERTDDGSKPEYAEVRNTADYVAGPGDVHLARPRDIHVELSIGERTAAIIIRSKKDGIPTNLHGRYNLVTHAYGESIGPRQIPAEILPPGE